jgi:ZIP family zinc transporter
MNALSAALLGGLSAMTLVLGAVVAFRLRPSPRAVGLVMGFGSGALLAAVAYELVPESEAFGVDVLIALAAGALTFFVGDWLIDQRGGKSRKRLDALAGGRAGAAGRASTGKAIFLGTLLDGVPESLILGIGAAQPSPVSLAFLAAILVSNLPEGIAGTTSLAAEGHSRRQIYGMWLSVAAVSALAAALGYGMMLRLPAADGHAVEAFAAGAMLTMLADVMMPEAFEHGGAVVGLLTVLGFAVAASLSIAA